MPNINTKQLSSPSRIQSGFYKMTKKCFFFQSKLFEAQVTELFDDLWPTVTAIKNLRWQVNGYYHEMNIKQNHKLSARFVDSEDITNRPNLYRTCIEQSWEQQEYSIARNLLTNIFALYEGWIEMILSSLGVSRIRDVSKKFQFPNEARTALANMQQHPNTVLVDALYDAYVNKNYESKLVHLENYLKVYRYFKECRNSIIHKGGKTNRELITAYNAIRSLTKADLDVQELPVMEAVTAENEEVKLSLRSVVGFSQIVIKIVEVLDAEFIKSDKAIDCFISQIKEFTPNHICPPHDERKLQKRIEGIMMRSGFLPPQHSLAFVELLRYYDVLTV